MGVNWDDIQLWLVLAAVAGAVFGLAASCAARRDRWGPVATAVLLGLLLGDAYRRLHDRGPDIAVAVDLLAAVVVSLVVIRANRRPGRTLAWTLLAAIAGFAVVSAPDALQQALLPHV
jgi:hypothetical protein